MSLQPSPMHSRPFLDSPFRRARLHGLYVITEEGDFSSRGSDAKSSSQIESHHIRVARAAIAGGASIIQLRDKSTPLAILFQTALALRRLTLAARVLFIVNDRPDLALACDADGVHLGPDDFPIEAARRVLGQQRLIGVSCNSTDEARCAFQSGADYVGAGAIFATSTKSDAGEPIGLEKLRAIVNATPLPVAAIGGVNTRNICDIAQNGAQMACVVSAITRAPNETQMIQATQELIRNFESAEEYSKRVDTSCH